jgi:hypothetical protein
MPYYPIIKAPNCKGWTTLCNFAPNNWEAKDATEKFISLTWAEEGQWRTELLDMLAIDAMRTISIEDVSSKMPEGVLPLLSLSASKPPVRSNTLPEIDAPQAIVPVWRATLGLSTTKTLVSYQGEIDPFPAQGSLLTFCPFIQFGEEIENYLLFLNMEKSPLARTAQVEVYDSKTTSLRGTFNVRNNEITIIELDPLGFNPTDLALIICRDMSAIPLYFSKSRDNEFLSLEHTHPPASYVIHGQRWEAQKILKKAWFSKVVKQ